MTDPSSPKSRRPKGREPQTIDLSATVIAETEPAAAAAQPASGAGDPPKQAPKDSPVENSSGTDDKTRTDRAPPQPEKPPVRAGSGRAAVVGLICGLVGGLVGGFSGAALLPMLKPPAPAIAPELAQRLAALEKRAEAPLPDPAAALAPRLGSIETALRQGNEKVDGIESEQQALAGNLQALAGRVDTLAADAAARAAAVREAAAGGEQAAAALPELEQRLAALDQRLSTAVDGVQAAVNANQNRLLDQEQRNIAPLSEKILALEKQVAAASGQKVDPLPAVRYTLVARLEQAMASGKPFAATLNALRKSGVAEADISDIAAFALTGAPTAAQLKAEFREPAQAMIGFERRQSGESFTDRLLRMSERVVRIRPRGESGANDLTAMTARIEAALDRGSFADAAALWNTLPETARQQSAAWGKRINDRANAAAALARLADRANAALEGAVR